MTTCFFAADLHGHVDRYEKLFDGVRHEKPAAVFLGGDLLPHGFGLAGPHSDDFIGGFLVDRLATLRNALGGSYPRIFVVMGNDDARMHEAEFRAADADGVWEYVHQKRAGFGDFAVYGYACVPPTPFQLKDWDRYDVSRHIDPGAISPEDGARTVPVEPRDARYRTIADDLNDLAGERDLSRAVFLFHSPPYQTRLDRAALDGQMIDHVPLDVNVGSIALRRFIEARQPLLTLHGHVHESTRLTESWQDRIGDTLCLQAAHDGPELSLIRFDLENPAGATRELL